MRNNEEKTIVKSITILGGTQVVNIVVGVIRNKVVSILLGATGMGVMSLYQSTSDILSTISNMGTSTTAVKNISNAYSNDDQYKLGFVHEAFKKIVIITGLLGFCACLLGAPVFSYINFSDDEHIWHFSLLAFSIFCLQLVAGYSTLLQGCRKYKKMSKATIVGNITGLFICVPLYFLFGIKAIVPVMVIYPIINYIVLRRAVSSISVPKVKVRYREAITYGKDIIKNGFFICLQSLFSLLYIYIIRLFLRENGGLATVGLFSSGMLVVNQYVGLVFSSMGTEYYPRLSAINDNEMFNDAINMQIRRSIIILAPLITLMMVLMPLTIRILFSEEFLSIVGMCVVLLASVGFRIVEWSFGYSLIARGRTSTLFVNELSFKIYTLVLSVVFYNIWGLSGIGLAYLLAEFIFSIQSFILVNRLWNFKLKKECVRVFIPSIVGILICMGLNYWMRGLICYTINSTIIIILSIRLFVYFKELNHEK